MHFPKIISLSALVLATSAFATPAKRDLDSDISAVLETLSTTASATLSQISALDTTTTATLTPLISVLASAFDAATSDLPSVSTSIDKRQTVSSVGTTLAGIITDVATTLSDAITTASGDIDVSSALSDLDTSISDTVTGVEGLVPDAEGVLSTELSDAESTLGGLSLTSTLTSVGL